MNTRKVKRRFFKVVSCILLGYIIFFIYNNLDLSKSREMSYYSELRIRNHNVTYDSYIIKGTEPIFLDNGGQKAILLLHGMGGTPVELKEFGFYLSKNNISVLIPLLDNQGRTFNEIKKMNRDKLYNQSLYFLNILKQNYRDVYVSGLSTGGLLSLKIAENEDISGVVSLAAPITYGFNFLGDSTFYLFKFLRLITPNVRRIEYGLAKNPEVNEILPSFDRLPVDVLLQGELLKREVKDNLNQIKEPILILQSDFDNRASPSSARYIFENINSSDKKLIYLRNSGHVITMDYDKEIIFEEVKNFIKSR